MLADGCFMSLCDPTMCQCICVVSLNKHKDVGQFWPASSHLTTLMVCHCRYQLLEIDSPRKVVFFGISRFHESTDTVTFNCKAGQNDVVEVEYTTDIELVRWYKYVLPKLISHSYHAPICHSACHALDNNVCLLYPLRLL